MLTTQEREHVRRLFAGGPAALQDEGFTLDQIAAFIAREDVNAELRMLDTEFVHREVLEGHSRFLTRRSLSRLSPGAVAVLARAMAGNVYARDEDGNILRDSKGRMVVRDAGPNAEQVNAAKVVLDELGIKDPRLVVQFFGDTADIGQIVQEQLEDEEKAKVVLKDDPNLETEEERALSRERVRTTIDKLLPRLRKRLEQKGNGKSKTKGSRKKSARKK